MKVYRLIVDILILVLLTAALLWCVFLFWGAYSQHRINVLLNYNTLKEIQSNIVNQIRGSPGTINSKTDEEIKRLQEAQKELFDTNTMSFMFQFVTLLLLTIGVAVLGLMYRAFRQTQEDAKAAQEEHNKIREITSRFLRGRNNTVVLALEYCLLHTLSNIFLLSQGKQKESLRIMMTDCQKDILGQLEDTLRGGEGFEESLFVNIVLDAALKSNSELERIKSQVQGFELSAVEHILSMSSQCLEILNLNGKEFVQRYNDQWKVITG